MLRGISCLSVVFLVFLCSFCLLIAACERRDSTDLVEKGGYPRSYPGISPKSTSTSLEKPNIEEEFFEADKLT